MSSFKNIIKKGFNALGYEMVSNEARKNSEREIANLNHALSRLVFIVSHSKAGKEHDETIALLNYSAGKLIKSKAQLFQDLFVLYSLKEKRDGFFIEFGATDGVSLSNTYLLEKEYNWKGILAEPGKVWQQKLKENRNCFIDNRCVWTKTGDRLIFQETNMAELSTINTYADADYFVEERKDNKVYEVETISLKDLLSFYNAPTDIDYLSIDTEGSEFDILNAFDFSKYNIKIITVEHNYAPKRVEIFNLLESNGYKRVFESVSLFDDWYIRESI